MFKAGGNMRFNHLYDHVLSELELGRTETAVNMLVGILDTAALLDNGALQARGELLDHPLLGMLQEDPLFGLATGPQSSAFALYADVNLSSTGRMLSAATRETALARALRDRVHYAEAKLHRSWRAGKQILLVAGEHFGLMHSLKGFDSSNVRMRDAGELDEEKLKYQLILAPFLPDDLTAPELAEFLRKASALLTGDGEIIFSALLPDHPGSGWRSICMGWNAQCHDDRALLAAVPTGFQAHIYHDERECVAWIEMRTAEEGKTQNRGEFHAV
jgi:hypothetical protein